jgi:hypothetical protein
MTVLRRGASYLLKLAQLMSKFEGCVPTCYIYRETKAAEGRENIEMSKINNILDIDLILPSFTDENARECTPLA